jgi:hypothetical protein
MAVAALTFTACGSSSSQTDASAFLKAHLAGATRVAGSTRAVQAEVSRLSSAPAQRRAQRLMRAAAVGHRDLVQASEWNVAAEGGEEEVLPRAEAGVTEGATELAHAMTALQAYVRAPSAAALLRYERELARGREQWNEGIAQIWYLAGKANPPTV